ncbi:ELOVL4 [Symbiodinium natans]|uniref:Elongation of fatty acids protein n=1 Tax=Symbiodinium natans TaxID=878477 RepID=A0A812R616_9DINO|nr:ELOVL4 [Symbiodinium natans]
MAGETAPDFADVRRGKLTQVDVLNSAPPWRKLRPIPVICTLAGAVLYTYYAVPGLALFGRTRWQLQVDTGALEPRAGGPFAEVSGSLALLLSLAYVSLTFVGLGRMAQRSLPVQTFIFECMAVHNATQCCYNLYCFVMLVLEGQTQGFQIWGNFPDATATSHRLGWLMWLQYHCRQLQLVETGFMVLQKKFQGVSFLHVYLRVLNLWGWFIACRCGCGAEAFVPALVSSGCQTVVYGLYSSFSCTSSSSRSDSRVSRASWVFRLQIAQYILCAGHSLAAAIWGHFPAKLAVLHLFVIGNGLILYTVPGRKKGG